MSTIPPYSELEGWRAKTRSRNSVMDPGPARRLAATLDRAAPVDVLPACWAWLYHLEAAPHARLGPDGHPVTGDFLPALPATRRMFAGSEMTFHAPVVFGTTVELRETVANVEKKTGKTDDLWLVTLAITLRAGEALLVEERRTVAYLPTAGGLRTGQVSDLKPAHETDVTPDEAMLFRFSALTFNSHRIHYDQAYATGVEGYPERVIHGPLQAMLLAGCAERWSGKALAGFRFRAVAPAFLGDTLSLCAAATDGNRMALEIRTPDGITTTKAQAHFASANTEQTR